MNQNKIKSICMVFAIILFIISISIMGFLKFNILNILNILISIIILRKFWKNPIELKKWIAYYGLIIFSLIASYYAYRYLYPFSNRIFFYFILSYLLYSIAFNLDQTLIIAQIIGLIGFLIDFNAYSYHYLVMYIYFVCFVLCSYEKHPSIKEVFCFKNNVKK